MEIRDEQLDEIASRIAARMKLAMAALPDDDPLHMTLTPIERRIAEDILGVGPSPDLLDVVESVLEVPEPEARTLIEDLRQMGFEIRRVG